MTIYARSVCLGINLFVILYLCFFANSSMLNNSTRRYAYHKAKLTDKISKSDVIQTRVTHGQTIVPPTINESQKLPAFFNLNLICSCFCLRQQHQYIHNNFADVYPTHLRISTTNTLLYVCFACSTIKSFIGQFVPNSGQIFGLKTVMWCVRN